MRSATMLSRTLLCLILASLQVGAQTTEQANPQVLMRTSKGDIRIELFAQQAPVTVANFLQYVSSGFYNGTIFHRIIPRFVVQGGGFDQNLVRKKTAEPIINESYNGLHNERWTLSMARTNNPDSATSQFFINLRMNASLDAQRNGRPGYAVFGQVVEGQHVVNDMAGVATGSVGGMQDVPLEPVVILSAEQLP